ncbi:MAG: hypothetical protein L0H73_08705 [Nitrococcus sp.]|nr:hypothetical protein [Nitrococcus sp.]
MQDFSGRDFFKGSDTSFGIFYPADYLIAVLDSNEAAKKGKDILLSAGYSEDEVAAVPNNYVISDIEKSKNDASFLTRIRQKFSLGMGTEGLYWEKDLEWAKEGAGFLAIYCPTHHEAKRVQRLLTHENPKNMRRYAAMAIEKLS